MKLVVNLKLTPTAEQAESLRRTLETCNAACNWLSETGWKAGVLRQYDLQKLTYYEVRERFGLTAQAAVRCIAKVADAYKLDRKVQRIFRSHAAQPYDDRIIRFIKEDRISIWTVSGREKIAFVCGERQQKLLPFRKGEVDLMFIRKKWYLAVVCDVDEPELIKTTDVLGVDLGIINLAVDSGGKTYSGATIEKQRRKHAYRRKNLQRRGTRAAKRKLRQISSKQARFQKNINHIISKSLVRTANATSRTIALEDLSGIRSRIKASRRQRARLGNWGFRQLQTFISYKAKLVGIPVVFVDPAYTSQTCPICGKISKRNRPTRDKFQCISCSFAGPADHVAARNIRARAVVNQPNVDFKIDKVASSAHLVPLSYKPTTLAVGN